MGANEERDIKLLSNNPGANFAGSSRGDIGGSGLSVAGALTPYPPGGRPIHRIRAPTTNDDVLNLVRCDIRRRPF